MKGVLYKSLIKEHETDFYLIMRSKMCKKEIGEKSLSSGMVLHGFSFFVNNFRGNSTF